MDGELTKAAQVGLHSSNMTETKRIDKGGWIFATAIAFVLLQNLPVWLSQPDEAFAQSLIAPGPSGEAAVGWLARIALEHGFARAWQIQVAITTGLQWVLALVAAGVLWGICRKRNTPATWRLAGAVCLAAFSFSLILFGIRMPQAINDWQTDSRIFLPTQLAGWLQTQPGPLFANPSAKFLLQPLTPGTEWVSATEANTVMADPAKWRQFDRTRPLGTVVFLGRVSEYSPLLAHLLASPDWSLAWADNFGIAFTRGKNDWEPTPANEIAADFKRPRDAALYLSQAALTLSLAGKNGDAIRYFDAAETLAPNEPEIFARRAVFWHRRNRFGDAVAAADQALELNPDLIAAVQTKALAQLSAQQPESAWRTAQRLPELAPRDPYSLFIFARCANAAHAYSAEMDTLERVIQLSEAQGARVTSYRIFLGQAYARRGLARQAMEQFQQAAKDPDLTPAQQEEIESSRAIIQSQIGAETQN